MLCVETNLKLGLQNGRLRSQKELSGSEVHFLRVEGRASHPETLDERFVKDFHLNCDVSRWVITEVDNYLDGNPHALKLYDDFEDE